MNAPDNLRVSKETLPPTATVGSRGLTLACRFAAILVVAMSALHDVRLLWQFGVPTGVDGYYYVVQIQSLQATGHLYFRTLTPLVFYAAWGLRAITGDPVTALKVLSVLLDATLTGGIFAVVFVLTSSEWAALIGVTVTAVSTSRLYFVADFTKNLACLAFLCWAAVFLIKGFRSRCSYPLFVGLLFAVAAALSHKSAILIVGVSLGFFIISASSLRRIWVMPTIAASIWTLPALLRFDAESPLSGIFVGTMPTASWWSAERLALLLISWTIMARLKAVRDAAGEFAAIVLGGIALFALAVTVNPLLNQNSDLLGGRISFTMFLQVAVLLPGLFLAMYSEQDFGAKMVGIPLLSALLLLSAVESQSILGIRQDYLARRTEMVSSLTRLRDRLAPRPTLVIAPHGDEFLVTAVLHVAAQQHWSPGSGQSLYWVLEGVGSGDKTPEMLVLAHWHGLSTVIVSSEDLTLRWSRLDDQSRSQLLTANPELLVAGYN